MTHEKIGRQRRVEWRGLTEEQKMDLVLFTILAWFAIGTTCALAIPPTRLARWTTGRWVLSVLGCLPALALAGLLTGALVYNTARAVKRNAPIRVRYRYPDAREVHKKRP